MPAHAHAPEAADPAQRARSELKARGLRCTPARVKVLAELSAAGRPLTRAELLARLPEGSDAVTVYRALESFVEAGLAQRTIGSDRIGRYAHAGRHDHESHGHFHCHDCGRVSCVPADPGALQRVPRGYVVEHVSLTWSGRCPQCAPAPRGRRAATVR